MVKGEAKSSVHVFAIIIVVALGCWFSWYSNHLKFINIPLGYEIGNLSWKSGDEVVTVGSRKISIEEFDRSQQELNANFSSNNLFQMKMSDKAIMKEGSKKLHLLVENQTINKADFYFDIVLDDKVIYTSEVLKPSQKVNIVKLDKSLPSDVKGLMIKYHISSPVEGSI
ncbi:hypothetical protein [Paenibacillus piri]|uniref:Uncharacterized protein n=1 Tax=Paenibacillus piri TaxID=2547395 RepID=A0A4R5KYF4_9BACL|nr:hypothetical protein [Paenibacillus piri]TDG00887.1 hypothetical protein E1757_04555 [Paenibacillus piri]